MKSKYKKYKVYIERYGDGCYAKEYDKYLVGETYAVSEKQAVNNVRYKNEGKVPNFWLTGDYMDEGIIISKYVAYLV